MYLFLKTFAFNANNPGEMDQKRKCSATSGSVDNFVYEEANETFINDPEMRKRLLELNPHSFRRIVGTLLEVNGRGYWDTSDENIQQLQELYQEVEDRIEGVAT